MSRKRVGLKPQDLRYIRLDMAWNRRFSGTAIADKGFKERTQIPMGDWCGSVNDR